MKTRKIYAENPLIEQWRILSQYTFIDNISKYHNEKNISSNADVKEFISGCLNQSLSYFKVANTANLDIKPPLVYYGAANLLAGSFALLTGNLPPVTTHGLKVLDNSDRFPLSKIKLRLVAPKSGAAAIYHANFFNNSQKILSSGSEWSVEELLSSIPDLSFDLLSLFPNSKRYVIPLERVKTKDGIIERIDKDSFTDENELLIDIKSINNLKEEYLEPQVTKKYIILRKKINSKNELGIFSISGIKYLQLPHFKNGIQNNTSQLIYLFMSLFFLGYISRYKPEIWNVFIRTDVTGEKYIFEKLLDLSIRFFPNLVLNCVTGSNLQFTNELDLIENLEER